LTDTEAMDDPGRHPVLARWLTPLIAFTVVVAVVLALARVVHLVTAFLGAAVVAVVLAVATLAVRGSAGVEIRRPGIGAVIGILVWIVVVGVFVYLATSFSDFGSP
jgi:hypothetical protein